MRYMASPRHTHHLPDLGSPNGLLNVRFESSPWHQYTSLHFLWHSSALPNLSNNPTHCYFARCLIFSPLAARFPTTSVVRYRTDQRLRPRGAALLADFRIGSSNGTMLPRSYGSCSERKASFLISLPGGIG